MVTWLYITQYQYLMLSEASTVYKPFHACSVFMNVCLSIFFLVVLRSVCRFHCIHTPIWESVYRSLTSVHSFLRTFCKTLNEVLLLLPFPIMFYVLKTDTRAAHKHKNFCCSRQHVRVRGLSGKYPAILNVSRTGSVALM
jgi:hypothetical protein